MGVILAWMANTYTLCAAVLRIYMQIQGDLIFFWFTLRALSVPWRLLLSLQTPCLHKDVHVSGHECKVEQVLCIIKCLNQAAKVFEEGLATQIPMKMSK